MLQGRQIFNGMGIDPDNYLILNFATTGVSSPIGVLEITGRYGETDEDFQYFIEPENMLIPSDLNFSYTGIPRHLYDENIEDTEEFIKVFNSYLRERRPEILIINNEWWVNKLSNERPNAKLSPFFAQVGNIPIFSISYYETARAGCDYTIFTPIFEFYYEMAEHIARMKKQASNVYKFDVDSSYVVRGGPEIPEEFGRTVAQEQVMEMRFIWEQILSNNEAKELYHQV